MNDSVVYYFDMFLGAKVHNSINLLDKLCVYFLVCPARYFSDLYLGGICLFLLLYQIFFICGAKTDCQQVERQNVERNYLA